MVLRLRPPEQTFCIIDNILDILDNYTTNI